MKRKYFISIIVFLLFSTVLFPNIGSYTIAREGTGISNLGSEDQKYYQYINDIQKKEITTKEFGDEQKLKIFEGLSDNDKLTLFKSLSYAEKNKLFKNLGDMDKRKIFSSLTDEEKSRWLIEYPELKEISVLGEVPSQAVAVVKEKATSLSDIEKTMSGDFPTAIDRTLRQFGYDYFTKGPPSFIPESSVPVGPDYIIGPNDRFTIYLWGGVEESYNVTVSRDGSITLPRLGTLVVAGLTFAKLEDFLLHKFREYYPDFEMSVTMGSLRTMEVFIIGGLDTAGTYSLTSLSTAISALFASGGPNKTGSMRDIKVYDNEQLIKSIDLYEFFIKGTKGNDILLQQGYTIFVPVIGPVVGIAGHVKRPAIYEIKDEQTIGDIIELAGGVLPTGHLQNVVIERIIEHKRRVINSFNLDPSYDKSDINLKTPVKDGDVIKIYPIYKRMEQVVYLEGHVKYPREYELKHGLRLADIIPSYDSLLPEPYLPQAQIIRLVPPDLHPEIVEFNLGSLLAGDDNQNLLLQDQDRIKIYGLSEKSDMPQVTIVGSLRNPGAYRLYKGMTIKDLIFLAGNLTNTAYMEQAELTRVIQGPTGTDTIKLTFSPQKALEGDPQDNIALKEDDLVQIRNIPKYAQAIERKITLEGEFMFPGTYSFSEGERLSSVISRAGGLTKEAYPTSSVFLRESVKEIQRERQKEYISRLEEDILTLSTASTQTSLDTTQAAMIQQVLNSQKDLIAKLKASEPTGRMVIKMSDIMLMPSSDYDVELRPGDRLIMSKRSDSVNVIGEVYNPNALLLEKGKDVSYYLSLVGGMTDNANKKQIYIIKADGTVTSKEQEKLGLFNWDTQERRWRFGSFNSMELDPGDTIIVPKKIERIGWLKYAKDVTGILYEIAIAAGVLHEIFVK
jgi:protein involved in polysaccharide export with SLBB domain